MPASTFCKHDGSALATRHGERATSPFIALLPLRVAIGRTLMATSFWGVCELSAPPVGAHRIFVCWATVGGAVGDVMRVTFRRRLA